MAPEISKPPMLHSRHAFSTALLILLSLLFLHLNPSTKPLTHLRNFRIPRFLLPNTTTKPPWPRPPALRALIPFIRGSAEGNDLRDHAWTEPKVLLTHARPADDDEATTQVFVYATGIRMGKFARNVTVAGCLISDDLYKAVDARGDVYICTAYRTVGKGESVSLVLLRDSAFQEALRGVSIAGAVVSLREVDWDDLPEGVRVRLPDARKAEEYAVLVHGGRVESIAPGLSQIREIARYRVCMGTQMKTFPHLLGDWARYHRKLGVDRVYILDNDAEHPLGEDVPSDLDGVEVVYWPFQKSQIQAMSYLLVALRASCEWILLSDADEYVLLGLDERGQVGDIREYLKGLKGDIMQHYLPYVTMGVSGHINMPKGPVAEEYTYKYGRQKRNGKTVARTTAGWLSSRIHVAWPGGAEILREGVVNDRPRFGEQAVLVHFQKRSFEEVLMKQRVGSGSLGDMQVGSGKKKKMTKVPKGYDEVDERNRYTFFRDVWRVVEAQGVVRQMLVKGEDVRWVGEQT